MPATFGRKQREGRVVCSCGNVIQRYTVIGDVPIEQTLAHPSCGREAGEDLKPKE